MAGKSGPLGALFLSSALSRVSQGLSLVFAYATLVFLQKKKKNRTYEICNEEPEGARSEGLLHTHDTVKLL